MPIDFGEGIVARIPRLRISEEEGSYHIISRVIGKKGEDFLIDEEGKNYLLYLLKLCCSSYFVKLHSFCILDNHFHLLISENQAEAQSATVEQLMERYRILKKVDYSHRLSDDVMAAQLQIDALRSRFSDISRFVQELKQCFGRWYNKKHDRRGTLWTDRFKSILVSKGRAQVDVSAYIELNPVRAGIVSRPEDYKWCSLGQASNAEGSDFISFIHTVEHENDLSFETYRSYVHDTGGIEQYEKEPHPCDDMSETKENSNAKTACYAHRLGFLSAGIVLGTCDLVEKVQCILKRKYIRGRVLLKEAELYGSRLLTPV
jgi:REP element-mobilizing transposase RayT